MSSQYRTYTGPPRPSHNAPPRRGPGPAGGPPHPHQMAQAHAQAMAAQQHHQQRPNIHASQVLHRARKPTDRNMPDGVEDIIVGEGVQEYKRARAAEKKLDALMMRKMLDLQDRRPVSAERTRTMRIWIFNTVEGQPWQESALETGAFDFGPGSDAKFRVKIVGKLLDDEEAEKEDDGDDEEEKPAKNNGDAADPEAMQQDGDGNNATKPQQPIRHRLSHYFKEITIEFDRAKGVPAGEGLAPIEWKRPQNHHLPSPPPGSDFDSLEFERKSDENLQCTINLYRDDMPERFALSRDLAEIVDAEEATREMVIDGIWQYARAMDLQHDEEKRIIQCDDRLRKAFGAETIFFPKINELLAPHMSALPPLKLPYTIRVDAEYHSNNPPTPTIYDVLVPAPDPLRAKLIALMNNPDYPHTLRTLAGLDDQLAAIVQGIHDSKARHSFFSSMGKEPVQFIKRWISSQQKDLEIIMGDSKFGAPGAEEWLGNEFRRGGRNGVWGTDQVRESVGLMVAKR